MVSGLSALGFDPNAPATGQSVCKPVTPEHSNGNSYPFYFQYICQPSFPSCLNGNPPILFPFIPLQATSSPTGGTPPLPRVFFANDSFLNERAFTPSSFQKSVRHWRFDPVRRLLSDSSWARSVRRGTERWTYLRIPAMHPFCLRMFTKCSPSNFFLLITFHFHGGGVPPSRAASPTLPRILQETPASPFYSCACPRGFKHRRLS
jgi:hypothetical protein